MGGDTKLDIEKCYFSITFCYWHFSTISLLKTLCFVNAKENLISQIFLELVVGSIEQDDKNKMELEIT